MMEIDSKRMCTREGARESRTHGASETRTVHRLYCILYRIVLARV